MSNNKLTDEQVAELNEIPKYFIDIVSRSTVEEVIAKLSQIPKGQMLIGIKEIKPKYQNLVVTILVFSNEKISEYVHKNLNSFDPVKAFWPSPKEIE